MYCFAIVEKAHDVLVILLSVKLFLNMNRLEPSVARGLKFGMRLYLHPCLCVQTVKALVRLTACATASKNWILIEYIIIMKIS